jgi:hypothetical protein
MYTKEKGASLNFYEISISDSILSGLLLAALKHV